MRRFNLNTITILQTPNSNRYPIKVFVKGKLIGGKRFKRDWIWLTQEEYRDVKIRELNLFIV